MVLFRLFWNNETKKRLHLQTNILFMTLDNLHPLVLSVGLARHDADWNWQDVCSPFARIYYVCSGEAKVILKDGATYWLRPGHLYFIPAFVKHSNVCEGPFVHYYVHVYEDGKIEKDSELEGLDLPFEVEAFDGDERLFARLTELNPMLKLPESNPDAYDNGHTLLQSISVNKQRPLSQKIESRGIVYMMLSRFITYATPKLGIADPRIHDAITYIRSHLGNRITIDELAGVACLSSDHFIRLFRQHANCTPLQYVNNKRIEKAQLMLFSTNISVKNLSYALGYEDASYFVRVFKRITGMTPQEYRKTYGQ